MKERVKVFIEYLGISLRNFEVNCELSNGTISNSKKLSPNSRLKISNNYPELNINWLITGEGEMLMSKKATAPVVNTESNCEKLLLATEKINQLLEEKIKDKEEIIQLLKKDREIREKTQDNFSHLK